MCSVYPMVSRLRALSMQKLDSTLCKNHHVAVLSLNMLLHCYCNFKHTFTLTQLWKKTCLGANTTLLAFALSQNWPSCWCNITQLPIALTQHWTTCFCTNATMHNTPLQFHTTRYRTVSQHAKALTWQHNGCDVMWQCDSLLYYVVLAQWLHVC